VIRIVEAAARITLLFVVGLLAGCHGVPDAAPRPNIILIYVDDLDFDEIGVYDHRAQPTYSGAAIAGADKPHGNAKPASRVLTPHIDSLARDGAMFTRFYVTSPVCTPSRYSALTGRYASRSQPLNEEYPPGGPALVSFNAYLGRDELTIAKALQQRGYRTGHVGKWHLTGEEPMVSRKLRHALEFDPRSPEAIELMRTTYEERQRFIRDTYGFDSVASLYIGNLGHEGWDRSLNYHNMEWVTAGALDFIEQRDSEQPFFLYVAPTLLHGSSKKYLLDNPPGATPLGFLEPRTVQPARETIKQRVRKGGFDRATRMYTWLDDAVGALLAKLDQQGIADDTLVMLVSDHQSRGKFTLHEGARVPALVRWSRGIEASTEIKQLSANIDLLPTFVELAGGDPGELDVDGRSLVPLLQGSKAGERESIYLEIASARGIVTKDWKYIAIRNPPSIPDQPNHLRAGTGEQTKLLARARRQFPHSADPDQLYHLHVDPLEQSNLASRPNYAARLAKMKDLLRREIGRLPHTFGEFKTR
jgi:arylsulfatase A-like enzyme